MKPYFDQYSNFYCTKSNFCYFRSGKVKLELRVARNEFGYTSYEFKSTSYEFKSTSYEIKSTS